MEASILRKVIALLDKAEATPFPAEAEAFTAKAQELIARHGMETAVAEARSGRPTTDEITSVTISVKAPYVRPKMSIISVAATANRCRAVSTGPDRVVIVGFSSDVEVVEVLAASLLIQASRAMATASARVGSERVKSFRNSFLVGFAHEVGIRLQEAINLARRDVESETGTSVALVLRDKGRAVDDAFAEQFPHVKRLRSSVSNAAGIRDGRAAGRQADIGAKRVGGARGALTR